MDYSNLTKIEVLKYIKNYKIDMINFPQNWNDEEILILELLNRHNNLDSTLYYASERLKNNKPFLLKLIRLNYREFEKLSEKFKDDKDIALEAIKKNWYNFHYFSERLKKDREFILEVIKSGRNIFYHLSKELKNDKEIIFEAVKCDVLILKELSNDFQNNPNLLNILEKKDISNWNSDNKKWFKGRMEILANLRDKDFMQTSIDVSKKVLKKVKF